MISTVTYNGDGATRIFPVAFEIKGEEYTVVYIGGVAVADRSLYDIINNSIVFNTAPVIGTNNVEIVVASTTTEIADLNAPPSTIQTVLDNMADINAIANTVIPNIDGILLADDNAAIATAKALEATISANNADVSEANALTSANNALVSETNADTSEAHALSYKNSAEASATTATTQAGIAVTKAGEASTSASNALASEQQAGVYAGMIAISVDTIENMTAISLPQDGQVVVVRDENRGGVFIFRDENSQGNNGGTIFNGWTRQYSGAVNVKWFGAKGDGATDDTSYFVSAEGVSDLIFVPETTFSYVIDTPFSLSQNKGYFGGGTLKFLNAEWWRAGGSAGTGATVERYTLFFNYSSISDVYCNFDDVPQTITWINSTTFSVPAPSSGVKVKYGVINGTLVLGDTPENIFSYNMFANGVGSSVAVLTDPLISATGFGNTAVGSRALINLTSGTNNTGIGSRSLVSVKDSNNNTGVGFQALYRTTGTGNTAVGSIAGEWDTTGSYNSLLGLSAGGKLTTGSYNTASGYSAIGENQSGDYNTAHGYRALGNSGDSVIAENTAIGAFAGDTCYGSQNFYGGYRAGSGEGGTNTGLSNVGVGFFAMRYVTSGSYNVAVGAGSLTNITNSGANVAVGYSALNLLVSEQFCTAVGSEALKNNLAAENTGIGYNALIATTTGIRNTAVGSRASRLNITGNNNTVVGRDAMYNSTSGDGNTAIGVDSLKLTQAGTSFTGLSNCTGIGYGASVSGSSQVQIGNSATTTYVYGTVQNRSDKRDKADIRKTILGLDFINKLVPVDYRWDMREDYIISDDEGNVTTLEKDGSKKRSRFHHGFIAQEVKAVCYELGVDFGGFQDHSVGGGEDVLSLGYDEFIPILAKAIQEINKKQDDIISRLLLLENKQ